MRIHPALQQFHSAKQFVQKRLLTLQDETLRGKHAENFPSKSQRSTQRSRDSPFDATLNQITIHFAQSPNKLRY